MKLGLKPFRPGSIRFKLGSYLDYNLITPPPVFGHTVMPKWGMLANDRVGCCVVAGAAHETMLWTRSSRGLVTVFDDKCVMKTYAEASGWNGKYDDASDCGLDMQEFAGLRRSAGIADAAGNLHLIEAYAEIRSVDHLIKAAYVFGAVGLGINVPDSAMKQFDAQQPWSIVPGAKLLGGHYIPVIGRNSKNQLVAVTWGRLQGMTMDFVQAYMQGAVAYISREYIGAKGFTPEMLNLDKLRDDLAALTGG